MRKGTELLFPIVVAAEDVPQIPGLAYKPRYISEAEAVRLTSAIDKEAWNTTWERRRQLYGATYGADASQLVRPIPTWAQWLITRLHADGVSDRPFDQMLVNEYLAGQGISLHRDHQPFDRTVVSLSLLSPCMMDFQHAGSGRRESLLLEPRSLLVISDEARYEWLHGIARRRNDIWHALRLPRARRLSVTFRLQKHAR